MTSLLLSAWVPVDETSDNSHVNVEVEKRFIVGVKNTSSALNNIPGNGNEKTEKNFTQNIQLNEELWGWNNVQDGGADQGSNELSNSDHVLLNQSDVTLIEFEVISKGLSALSHGGNHTSILEDASQVKALNEQSGTEDDSAKVIGDCHLDLNWISCFINLFLYSKIRPLYKPVRFEFEFISK